MVKYTKEGNIRIIELEHVPVSEPLWGEFLFSFDEVMNEVAEDRETSVVVMAAAEGALDLTEVIPLLDYELYPSLTATVSRLPSPLITAAGGNIAGPGLELFLVGDIRVASVDSLFSLPQVSLGFLPHDGGTQRLPRLVGRTKASEMLLTGMSLKDQEALRYGLVHRLYPPETVKDEALKLARNLSIQAPFALKFAKEAITRGLELPLAEALRMEADLYFLLHTTEDRKEGITAFRERRKPRFLGK